MLRSQRKASLRRCALLGAGLRGLALAVAAWRLVRADRIEAELFAERVAGGGTRARPVPGRPWHPVVRDPLAGASTDLGDRCAPTNRYSGAVMAEFWRALRALKALQVDARAYAAVSHLPLPTSGTAGARGQPIEPETRHPGGRRAA